MSESSHRSAAGEAATAGSSAPVRQEALEEACKTGDHSAAMRLIRAGADPSQTDASGRTPLSYAVEYGQSHVMLLLLEDPNVPINTTDEAGRSAMHYAAARGHADLMRVLLSEGAEPDLLDMNGCTPLLYAAAAGHSRCVELLASQPNVTVNQVDEAGFSSLMLASSVGDLSSVTILLDRLANIDDTDEEGMTALMYACTNNQVPVVAALVNAGANLTAENNQGQMALYMTTDVDIRHILETKMAASDLYHGRFSVMDSSQVFKMPYGLVEEAYDIFKGVAVEMQFYSSKTQRDTMEERLRRLNADFIASPPVTNWEKEIGHYVFTDAQRHPKAPYCIVVAAGEVTLETVLRDSSMMSFMEIMHIVRALLECVEHLHLRNVVHCSLSAASFMRFYDGIYRIVDLHTSRDGSEFYEAPSPEESFLEGVPPELARFYLQGQHAQPVKTSRDVWSIGTILLLMVTGDTITSILKAKQVASNEESQPPSEDSGAAPQDGETDVLQMVQLVAELEQSTVESLCRGILEKSLKTYTVRFPDSRLLARDRSPEGVNRFISSMASRSPAVARLVDMMGLLEEMLSVNPAQRPTCTQALNYNIFRLSTSGPAIKSQELLKLQLTSSQAEARQMALMEEISANLKVTIRDLKHGGHQQRR